MELDVIFAEMRDTLNKIDESLEQSRVLMREMIEHIVAMREATRELRISMEQDHE